MTKGQLLKWGFVVLTLVFVTLILGRFLGGWASLESGSKVADRSETSESYQLRLQKCWFKAPWQVEIDCAQLSTPAPSGAYQLPVVIIRSGSAKASDSPLLYLQGGPGASAGLNQQGIEYWLDWIDYAQLDRDLVLMDRRGAGLSKPRLDCPEYDRFSREVLGQAIELEEELIQGKALVEQCFRELAAGPENFSAAQFGTEQSAQDILGLMDALDYPQWNLLGVSYGSRLAMAVAASPEAQERAWVRSLILDSVYPPERGGIQSWPQVMTEGLERFLGWCENSIDCRGGSKDLKGEFRRALEALEQSPVELEIRFYNGGTPVQVVVDDHRFISAVFSAVYQRHRWGDIVPAIEAVLSGEQDELQALMKPFINQALDQEFSSLAFFAVDCRDHPVGAEADYRQALRDYPEYASYLELGWRYQACHFLTAENTEALSRKRPPPELPALLLAGELDPITPLGWARELHRDWPKSQLAIFPDLGHSVIGTDGCAHAHFREFLRSPDMPWAPECLPQPISEVPQSEPSQESL